MNRNQLMLTTALTAAILALGSATALAKEIKIGYYAGAVMTIPSWIAVEKGFYAEQGLEPVLIPVASGPLMSSNTASGAIDIGYNSPSNVGLTREQGFNQSIVLGNMYMPIVILARSDVKTPNLGKYPDVIKDLKGLNIGSYGRGSDIENIMRVMVRDAKMAPDKDVTWIGVGPPPTGLPSLQTGRVDVYGTTMPAAEVAVAAGYGKIIVDLRKGEGPGDFRNSVYSVLLASTSRLEKEPDFFGKVVEAHKRTYCWLKDPKNLPEAEKIVKSKMPVAGLSPDQYSDLVKNALRLATVKYPPEGLDGWNKVMIQGGILKEPIPASVVWKNAPKDDPSCS
jgi:NitT/TauT family transport system substrate-binding protein